MASNFEGILASILDCKSAKKRRPWQNDADNGALLCHNQEPRRAKGQQSHTSLKTKGGQSHNSHRSQSTMNQRNILTNNKKSSAVGKH
jgi:hypothetical protein